MKVSNIFLREVKIKDEDKSEQELLAELEQSQKEYDRLLPSRIRLGLHYEAKLEKLGRLRAHSTVNVVEIKTFIIREWGRPPTPSRIRKREFHMEPNDPKLPQAQKIATLLTQQLRPLKRLQTRIDRIPTIIKNNKATTGFPTLPQHTIPDSSVPQRVDILVRGGKNRRMNNPYWNYGPTARYAGSPTHYPWTTKAMKYQYVVIHEMLIRNGLTLDALYGGTELPYEFLATGANGLFLWRKKGGGQSGVNYVWINGEQHNTSSIITMTKSEQDDLIGPIK